MSIRDTRLCREIINNSGILKEYKDAYLELIDIIAEFKGKNILNDNIEEIKKQIIDLSKLNCKYVDTTNDYVNITERREKYEIPFVKSNNELLKLFVKCLKITLSNFNKDFKITNIKINKYHQEFKIDNYPYNLVGQYSDLHRLSDHLNELLEKENEEDDYDDEEENEEDED